ncbi:hypothetical protein CVT26_012192 [Gymnopilus dilepis]|uniref:OTU domain-containing protein n=1 Tax=Gymnopilus dilepis TaxID=231916 RepID=A0A409W9I8_9AGAR|nr:hypothetical protein CVT26_012192 [Gymnopilus dilepis]
MTRNMGTDDDIIAALLQSGKWAGQRSVPSTVLLSSAFLYHGIAGTGVLLYHDWEHFSSIRNLRGPHTGLPCIQETPAPDYIDPSLASHPPSHSASAPPLSEKEKLKEREREKKRERERKEKEREKERRERGKGALKVKLKLGAKPGETPTPSEGTPAPSLSVGSTPAPVSTSAMAVDKPESKVLMSMKADPAMVPLPTSRAASPFVGGSTAVTRVATPGLGPAGYASSPLTSLPSSTSIASIDYQDQTLSLSQGTEPPHSHAQTQSSSSPPLSQASQATEPPQSQASTTSSLSSQADLDILRSHPLSPLHAHSHSHSHSHSRHAHLQAAARTQHRSPKRSFDESSASGGDGEDGEKRSRRRIGSLSAKDVLPGAGGEGEGEEDMDIDVDIDGDAETGTGTPALSAPGTSSSSSSETGSEVASELSSPPASVSPSPPPGHGDAQSASASVPPLPLPPSALESPKSPMSPGKLKKRFQHQHHVQGEKALTRRQRKALGLPKARPGMHVNGAGAVGVGGVGGVSAGKIVIPGGRWVGNAAGPGVTEGGAGAGAGGEGGVEEEWRRNGTGRLDVRGFRELKI